MKTILQDQIKPLLSFKYWYQIESYSDFDGLHLTKELLGHMLLLLHTIRSHMCTNRFDLG